jgi:hypothetical protein
MTCGAVRVCACHGLEHGALLQTISGCRVQQSVSHEQCIGISNKQVCRHATDSPSHYPLLWRFQLTFTLRASSTCPKMHFNSLLSRNPTPPHHLSPASTWPISMP